MTTASLACYPNFVINCSGLQTIRLGLANKEVFGSDYLQIESRLDSDYLQIGSNYLQIRKLGLQTESLGLANKKTRLRLSANKKVLNLLKLPKQYP